MIGLVQRHGKVRFQIRQGPSRDFLGFAVNDGNLRLVRYVDVDVWTSLFQLKRFWMRIELCRIIQAFVRGGIDDADTRFGVLAISDVHAFCARIVPEIVGVRAKIQSCGKSESLAVVHPHLSVAGVGDENFIDVASDVEYALGLIQPFNGVNDFAGEGIDDLHAVVSQRGTDHQSAFRIDGEMVNAANYIGEGNRLHDPQWGTLSRSIILCNTNNGRQTCE